MHRERADRGKVEHGEKLRRRRDARGREVVEEMARCEKLDARGLTGDYAAFESQMGGWERQGDCCTLANIGG